MLIHVQLAGKGPGKGSTEKCFVPVSCHFALAEALTEVRRHTGSEHLVSTRSVFVLLLLLHLSSCRATTFVACTFPDRATLTMFAFTRIKVFLVSMLIAWKVYWRARFVAFIPLLEHSLD